MNFICGGHFTFGGRGIWWFRWYFWYFVWWLYDLGWLFGIWTDIFCVFTCAFGMLGNIFDIWIHPCLHFGCCVLFFLMIFWFFGWYISGAQLSGAQFATFSGRTVGPRTTGPRGPTVRGPICHFFRADSWAPDNRAPGYFCYFFMICDFFCNSRWYLNVWGGVHWILDGVIGILDGVFSILDGFLVLWTMNLIFWRLFQFWGWVFSDWMV